MPGQWFRDVIAKMENHMENATESETETVFIGISHCHLPVVSGE